MKDHEVFEVEALVLAELDALTPATGDRPGKDHMDMIDHN
jgi:hypothetical protein